MVLGQATKSVYPKVWIKYKYLKSSIRTYYCNFDNKILELHMCQVLF